VQRKKLSRAHEMLSLYEKAGGGAPSHQGSNNRVGRGTMVQPWCTMVQPWYTMVVPWFPMVGTMVNYKHQSLLTMVEKLTMVNRMVNHGIP